MENKSQPTRRQVIGCGAGALFSLFVPAAFANSIQAYSDVAGDLTVCRPSDSNFGEMLSQYFPGFAESSLYPKVKAHLLLVANHSSQSIRAMQAIWTNPLSSLSTGGLTSRYVIPPHKSLRTRKTSGSKKLLHAGEIGLVTPFFVWRNTVYKKRAYSTKQLERHLKTTLRSRKKHVRKITKSTDPILGHIIGVIYKNHSVKETTGADLHQYFSVTRNAEHDEALSLLKVVSAAIAKPESDVKEQVSAHITNSSWVVVTSFKGKLYNRVRRQYARRVLRHLNENSIDHTAIALKVVKRKPKTTLKSV